MRDDKSNSALRNTIVGILFPIGMILVWIILSCLGKTETKTLERVVCPSASNSCQKTFVRYVDDEVQSFEYSGRAINIDFCKDDTCFEESEDPFNAPTWEMH